MPHASFPQSLSSLSATLARKGHCVGGGSSLVPQVPASASRRHFKNAVHVLEKLGLTPRQAEVLHWIAEGKTNEEISQILECSFHTVKNHVKEIFQRLGVSSRTAAAACAYRAHINTLSDAAPANNRI
ncbi:MAG: helix-turn-helix transcriptional regulator [Nitrospira sp.]|nr:helix-turn-helix transcriptional regulator [Nitrospira sp.]